MLSTDRIEHARQEARKLLKQFGVEHLHHIQIEAFAERLEVSVKIAPLEGATAQLVVVDGRKRIVVADRITDKRAIRWAVAHELGHLYLRHPSSPVAKLCAPDRPSATELAEQEADAFAQELLMPLHVLTTWCDGRQMNLGPARELTVLCGVSLETSTKRIVQATKLGLTRFRGYRTTQQSLVA